jgi:hypothetical protein
MINGELVKARLLPEVLQEDPDWSALVDSLPMTVIPDPQFRGDGDSAGQLIVRKSLSALIGRDRHQNSIVVMDQDGNPVASHSFKEIGLPGRSSIVDFLHGGVAPDVSGC